MVKRLRKEIPLPGAFAHRLIPNSLALHSSRSNQMAPTDEKKKKNFSGSIYMPDDIVFSILSKLSVKSCKRFSCVRKSWFSLFENPIFINMFRKNLISKSNPIYDNACLILNQFESPFFISNFYLLSGDTFEKRLKLDLPPPFDLNLQWMMNDKTPISILGSVVNGILCIYDSENPEKNTLWNPATNEIKAIPPSLGEVSTNFVTEFDLHGFGYDHVRGDYKLIQHVHYLSFDKNDCYWVNWDELVIPKSFWEIYSLKSNSWRKLDFDMPDRYMITDIVAYLNGVCYWMGKEIGVTYLVSFDLCKEVVFITPLPLEVVHDDFDVSLLVLNGSVAIITYEKNNTSFQISILGELGVKESWIKLFDIKHFPGIEQPIGTGKKGNIFFRKKEDDELACFDLTTGMIKEIGFKGERFWCQMLIYKENLHPIGGINK